MINDDNKNNLPGGISEPQSTDDIGRRLPEELPSTDVKVAGDIDKAEQDIRKS